MKAKKTKIVCTIGPASTDKDILIKMIKAGMNAARLNFSHGSQYSQLKLARNVRKAANEAGKEVSIIQDLQGPKIRLGNLPNEGITLKRHQLVVLDTSIDEVYQDSKGLYVIPVAYKSLHKDVKKADIILIEDGLIRTVVQNISGSQISVKCDTSGILKSHKGLNVPTASISANPLTKKDLDDLKYAIKNISIDFVALSFVRKAEDIEELRHKLKQLGSEAQIIAKIERHEALDNIIEIIDASDVIMVARGDLGVETPATDVPIAQKLITKLSGERGKPVIIATEMLQSMIENPRATRAEVNDAANAVFDHADALMLSNETAIGKYPTEAIKTLCKVAKGIEEFQRKQNWTRLNHYKLKERDPIEICQSATLLASEVDAKYIVAITESGFTARHIARQRIFQPIIVCTQHSSTAKKLNICWGINKCFVTKLTQSDTVAELLQKNRLVKKGDKIVLVSNAASKNPKIILKEI